ncbi:MAG: FG-GAP repeat protein, partial [Candidatus Fibromonas sp.]|nr:FG-GAP repeat protein [Candidatus Fibromonas sp.]
TPETHDDIDESVKINREPIGTGRIQAVYESNLGYRKMKRNEIPDTSDVIGLFQENDAYYLKPEKIAFEEGFSECAEVATLSLVSEAKFLFLNFANYNKDKIQAIPIHLDGTSVQGKDMEPGEKFTFDYSNVQYEFEAFGERDKDNMGNITNHSLVYSIKGAANKQTIANIPLARGTIITLLFIGDLDGDGKPDIILNAPSDYEDVDIMVFLSSTAKDGEYLRLEARKADSFDC